MFVTGVVHVMAGYALYANEPRVASPSRETTEATVSRSIPERHSPHEAISIHVYVTPEGEQTLRGGTPEYHVGTILLKEKLIGELERRTELFTGMLKRESGYNPDCGDWEFFTIDGSASRVTARGRIDSCMECHSGYKDSGYVVRDYMFDDRRARIGAQHRPAAVNAAIRERQWRDSDLVATTRGRSLRMVRVTDEPYADLDSSAIMQCAVPDNIPRSYIYSSSQTFLGRIEPASIRDRDYIHTGDDRTPFFGTFGEVPEFSNQLVDQKGIPRILLEP
jgi:hypothetical protein